MEQHAKYPLETFDKHNKFWYESNCGDCEHLIDGLSRFICDKHPEQIPADFWNNKSNCPQKKGCGKFKALKESEKSYTKEEIQCKLNSN